MTWHQSAEHRTAIGRVLPPAGEWTPGSCRPRGAGRWDRHAANAVLADVYALVQDTGTLTALSPSPPTPTSCARCTGRSRSSWPLRVSLTLSIHCRIQPMEPCRGVASRRSGRIRRSPYPQAARSSNSGPRSRCPRSGSATGAARPRGRRAPAGRRPPRARPASGWPGTQPAVAQPQPVMLAAGAQQHLGHRQAHQLGVGQSFRLARAVLAGTDHVIVDLHGHCDQEGIQVWRHNRPWMPSLVPGSIRHAAHARIRNHSSLSAAHTTFPPFTSFQPHWTASAETRTRPRPLSAPWPASRISGTPGAWS